MIKIQIMQIGMGGVGRALVQQVLAQRIPLSTRYGFVLDYVALLDQSGALHTGQALTTEALHAAVAAKQDGHELVSLPNGHAVADWLTLLPSTPCIIVDVTAADGMEPGLIDALTAGQRVVLANKRPLTGTLATFIALTTYGQTRYEATVGAGLPIISTLQTMLDSGDTLLQIEASMSGTLAYLCSALEQQQPLSAAVQTARSRGWTEPDPRDDLSGADVARKALILARTAGLPWDMSAVPSEPWFPPELAALSVEEFMQRLPDLDARFAHEVAQARAQNMALRYVATITPAGASVALKHLPIDHPLATLRGTDNLFALTTTRYETQPLVVRGPGAGVDVTAAGVLGDIVATAREMNILIPTP